jgi:Fur family ferric uptake transcriptional regulator
MTRQRSVILDTLLSMRTHPTADELYAVVRRQLPSVSLGTIYRNLDVLARSGQVRKLEAGGSQARFDAELEPHHHVRCGACGRVDDVAITHEFQVTGPEQSQHGFSITGYRIEYEGLCPDCRAGSPGSFPEPTEGYETP